MTLGIPNQHFPATPKKDAAAIGARDWSSNYQFANKFQRILKAVVVNFKKI